MTGEIWKVANYKTYEPTMVSNMGRVMQTEDRIVYGHQAGDYMSTTIKCKLTGKIKLVRVHRLIMTAFHGENSEMQVNHKDGNKLNNNVNNLEYMTGSENVKHAYDTGILLKEAKFSIPIIVTQNGKQTTYKSGKEAALAMKVSCSHISNLCNRGHISPYGFTCRRENQEVCDYDDNDIFHHFFEKTDNCNDTMSNIEIQTIRKRIKNMTNEKFSELLVNNGIIKCKISNHIAWRNIKRK